MKRFLAVIMLFFVAAPVFATDAAPAEEKIEAPKYHSIFFKPKLSVSFVDNRNVPGKTDGIYFRTDLDVVLNYKYAKDMHEFLIDLGIKEAISYTPLFDGFVIAADVAKLEMRYNLLFNKWSGYYLKAGLETHFFPGYDYSTDAVDYNVNGQRKARAKKYELTTSGLPLFLYQGTGLFYRPIDTEESKMEFNLGLAAREVFVGDSLIVNDDAATPEKELTSMTDIYEVGGEAGFTYKGTAQEKKVGYDIMAKAIMPFYSKERENLGMSWGDIFQFEGHIKLEFNINKYASFNYEFTIKIDFAIVKEWQMTNGLYLSLFYEIDKKM
ncbi:MAG TPA: hypothetical protein PKM18_02420 [bacterium]|nr:hypothetical protein [bacterium]